MSASDDALARAHVCLQEARDHTLSADTRVSVLDGARNALLDARRARALPEQMHPLLVGILDTAIVDQNHHARALVAQVIEDTVIRDMKTFAVTCAPYMQRLLDDAHIFVIKRGVRAFTTLFRKVLGYIVSIGVGEGATVFPSESLRIWLEMQKQVVDLINSPDAGIQKAATKFSETVGLALSYTGGRPMAEHFTLDYAVYRGLDHPLLDLAVLEAEGRRCVSMVTGLVYTGLGVRVPAVLGQGQQYIPSVRVAPASLMTALSVIGNLARRREKICELTVPPLLLAVRAIVGGRGVASPVYLQLPEGQRKSVVMMLRLTLFASRAYPHMRANTDLMSALNDIHQFEMKIAQETRARLQKQAEQAKREASATRTQMRAHPIARPVVGLSETAPPHTSKRPRILGAEGPRIIVPDRLAFDHMQIILRSMPPKEVIHFVMTRLLLDTPEAAPSRTEPPVAPDARALKRARKTEPEAIREAMPRKAVAVVRKQLPAVKALKLRADGMERLLHRVCKTILTREQLAIASGANRMRRLVLGRLLARIALSQSKHAWALCNEACSFIVDNIETRAELALAWLHAVLVAHNANKSGGVREDNMVLDKQCGLAEPNCGKSSLTCGHVVKTEASVFPAPVAPSLCETQDEHESAVITMPQNTTVCAKEEQLVVEQKPLGEAQNADGDAVETDEEEIMEETPIESCDAYEKLLTRLLELIMESDNTNDSEFTRLIVEAPIIPHGVVQMLSGACRDVTKNELALKALHDIICGRFGTDRAQALDILLSLAVDPDDVIRGPVIRLVANRLFCDLQGTVPLSIEAYSLSKLTGAITGAQAADGTAELERCTWLITALCAQKHELLHELAKAYILADEAAREVLLNRAKLLSGQLGADSPAAIALIRSRHGDAAQNGQNDADDNKDFALTILRGIIKKYGKPIGTLVEAACVRFGSTSDARFLEAVLSGLSRSQLMKYLGDLVELAASSATKESNGTAPSLDSKPFRYMFRSLMESQPPALSPCDLLIALHELEPSTAVSTAIRACFELKPIFKQGVIAQALQKLLEQTPLSSLLMNTVRLTHAFHTDRERYLNETILVSLISKKVWTNDTLWADFLRYCSEIMEKSAPILLKLPVSQLEDAFDKRPGLAEVFRAIASNPKTAKRIPVKQRKAISAALTKP